MIFKSQFLYKNSNYQTHLTFFKMIIFENKISIIEYDAERENVTYVEAGIPKKGLLIEQLKAVMEFSKTAAVTSIIADLRRQQGSFKSAFDFLDTKYYPALKARGLKCKAFILTEDIINNFLVNELVGDLKKHEIIAAIFSDLESATEWVSKQVKTKVK